MIAIGMLVLAALLFAALIGTRSRHPLTALEIVYVVLSPIPAIMTFIFPVIITWHSYEPESRRLSNTVSNAGLFVSAALAACGVALMARRFFRVEEQEQRLIVAFVLAAIPASLALMVVLMYAIL